MLVEFNVPQWAVEPLLTINLSRLTEERKKVLLSFLSDKASTHNSVVFISDEEDTLRWMEHNDIDKNPGEVIRIFLVTPLKQ
jgi:hypothetical protein